MKHLFSIILVLTFSCFSFGQNNIDYIKQELKNLEVKLLKKGEHLQLSNQQTEKFTKLFESKAKKVTLIELQNKSKDEISIELLKLEKEYLHQVNRLLTREQLNALKSDDSIK